MFHYKKSSPRWINFENRGGSAGRGGLENRGAKGHAFEILSDGEEKVLCDFDGSGVVRRIWVTLSDRDVHTLQNVIVKMYWDHAGIPQVDLPLGDFFGINTGKMTAFHNRFFSTAEGRSLISVLPMPFRRHCRIVLCNCTGSALRLFYDVDISLEKLPKSAMYFHTEFKDYTNALEEDVEILCEKKGKGRYLGTSFAVYPDRERYGDMWWGEGEAKIYLNGEQTPTLCGTGAEDYIGSAWELGEFVNDEQGCLTRDEDSVGMYRYHVSDPIYFDKGIRVTLQAMGGGPAEKVKAAMDKHSPLALVSYDNGVLHPVYRTETADFAGYVNFFRQDRYRITAYYYLK